MRDSAEILDLFTSAEKSGRKMVIATVVDVEGSAYRRPGAHLLLVDDSRRAGSISAGCLEADILARTEELFTFEKSILLQYNNDEFFGLNYGCDGTIRVLVEPITNSKISFPKAFQRANEDACQVLLATVFDCQISEHIGKKLLCHEGKVVASDLPPAMEKLILNSVGNGLTHHHKREYTHGKTKVFFEVVKPSIRLVVFGAGDDVIPLLKIARSTGIDVHLIDTRRSYLDRHEELATLHQFSEAMETSKIFDAPERTAAVVMSHNFELDKRFLRFVAKLDCAYVGLMGSRKRSEKLFQELRQIVDRAGGTITHHVSKTGDALDVSRIRFPIGLDLGAESPEEIALSICSEILAFFRQGSAQPLSQVSGPVHLRIEFVSTAGDTNG